MDLRRVVGGLIARNAVLSTLLMNYADRLRQGRSGHGTATAACFIVPDWSQDQLPSAPLRGRLFTVEAHTSRTDPRLHGNLDTILGLVDVVLTDDHASTSITARRVDAAADLRTTGSDTVVRVGSWDITPIPSCGLAAAERRLRPWPDCATSVLAGGALTPGLTSTN
jgi:hypothetical protein